MTIKSDIRYDWDLLNNQDWPLFSGSDVIANKTNLPKLAMVSFTCQQHNSSLDVHALWSECIMRMFSFLLESFHEFAEYKSFLFIATSNWLKPNRVLLHKRLWKSLDVSIDPLHSIELKKESDLGVLFYGITEFDFHNASEIAKFSAYSSSAFILTRRNELATSKSADAIFQAAFPKVYSATNLALSWPSLCIAMCTYGDIVVRCYPSYDEKSVEIECCALQAELLNSKEHSCLSLN